MTEIKPCPIRSAINLAEEGRKTYRDAGPKSIDVLHDLFVEIKNVLTPCVAMETEAQQALGTIRDCFADDEEEFKLFPIIAAAISHTPASPDAVREADVEKLKDDCVKYLEGNIAEMNKVYPDGYAGVMTENAIRCTVNYLAYKRAAIKAQLGE